MEKSKITKFIDKIQNTQLTESEGAVILSCADNAIGGDNDATCVNKAFSSCSVTNYECINYGVACSSAKNTKFCRNESGEINP